VRGGEVLSEGLDDEEEAQLEDNESIDHKK
jgi:hypothetical protein